jgi:hypothetical protein
MIPPPPMQSRALCRTSIYLVICIPELLLRDFGGRSISLSVRPRPLHQLAPEPPPEARSARRSSQYLKPMRYFSSAMSGPAPVPPALLHASSIRLGHPNLPRLGPPAFNCPMRLPGPPRPGSLAQVRRRLCPARNNRSVRAGHSQTIFFSSEE